MQLKTSYFNPTLFRKNLTRFWPLWGMAGFIGVLFPLTLFTQMMRGYGIDALEMRELYYSVAVFGVPLISLFYAVLCAVAVWSYLYNPRSVGLMHTLPIRREGLFITNFLSGMAMMLIPYVLTGAVTIVATIYCGCFDAPGVLAAIGTVLADSFFYFSTATVVAFVTGNVFAMPVLYFIFHFLAVIMDFMVSTLSTGFLFGLNRDYNGVAEWLSPTVYLLSRVDVDSEWEEYQTAGGYLSHRMVDVSIENWHLIAVYAAVGAVCVALSWMLYKRRRSESAGEVVAVGWMKPVFLWGVTVCCALMGGQLLYVLFFSDDGYASLPMLFFMTIAGGIGYYAARMLLAKSLRVFQRSWKGVAALAVLSAALCLTLEADLMGVERRVPTAGQMEKVTVWVANNSYTLYPGQDDALIEQLRALHGAVAEDKDYIENFVYTYTDADNYYRDVSEYNTLRITYYLKGGAEIYRWYQLPLTRDRMDQPGTYDYLMNAFVNGQEAKAERLHLNDSAYGIESARIWNISSNYESYGFSSHEAEALLQAIGRDLESGAWGNYDFFESTDAGELEPNIEITFRGTDSNGDYHDYISIVLRPEMTETLKFLTDMGILTDWDLIPLGQKYPDRYENQNYQVWEKYEDHLTSFYGARSSTGIIGGADGPTSIIVADMN